MTFLICFVVKSQKYDVHVPWELKGAYERIDKYRKGKAKLLFVFDNNISEFAKLDLGLTNHAFNFGVSMTFQNGLLTTMTLRNWKKLFTRELVI